MNDKKLNPQVVAIGQIYRVITDVCPQAQVNDPEMRPMRTYTMSMLRLQQNRKSTPKIEKILSELSDKIEVDDWEGNFDTVVSPELKYAFYAGFYRGAEKTKLAKIRKSINLTQSELAEKIGVTQKDVSRWEQGSVKPNSENLKKLADALNCKMDDLMDLE